MIKPSEKTVIILENETDIAQLLAQLIRSYGANPVICTDEESLMTAVSEEDVALALLDIMLPKTDGRNVAAALRQRNVAFPIYYMTGIALECILPEHMALADGVLRKPYTISELRCLLDSVLKTPTEASPEAQAQRKVIEMMTIVATEQEDIRRKQASLLNLIRSLETQDPTVITLGEQLHAFSMGLEACMARLSKQLQEVREMLHAPR